MRHYLLVITLVLISFSCENEKQSNKIVDSAPSVTVFQQFDELSPKFYNNSDTTYIVNFWATSSPPCIKEMPHFNEFHKNSLEAKTKILLVSLDRFRDLDNRVIPFVEKYNLKPEVTLLADQNYSAWTEKIDSSWYGALPATMIIKSSKKEFKFGAFESLQELEEMVSVID